VKAIVMSAPGTPDVLKLQEVPEPKLEHETDVLIQLKAAGVNPIDTKLRQRGTFFPDEMPAILGCDGAGVVTEIGAKVRQFRVGDAVYWCNGGLGRGCGNYAEYAVVDERFISHKPNSLSFEAAAAAPLVLITAWEALFDRAHLEAGRSVLVHAGAGGVGHVAVQLAALAGATVATTVSSAEKARIVTALGAHHPVLYPEVDWVQDILAWTDGEGVDLGFDTVGGALLSQTFAATRIYGNVVTLLGSTADTDWKTARDRNLSVSFELMLTPMLKGLDEAQQEQAKILQQCARLIDQEKLSIHVSQVLPLADAAEAHRLIEQGSTVGKIVLSISA
jgi:NADPH:quinone reductase